MTGQAGVEPYDYLDSWDGQKIPFYIVSFNKRGLCTAPLTRAGLCKVAKDYTDIFVFSHGWNNDWSVATERYREFFSGYVGMRKRLGLPMLEPYRPLLVGIFWPSTALVFGKSERGPDIASASSVGASERERQDLEALEDLADSLSSDEERIRLYTLAQEKELSEMQARSLAELAARILRDSEGELESDEQLDVDSILRSWAELPQDDLDPELAALIASGAGGVAGVGKVARALDPRRIIRLLTVAKMKDRAGVVGTAGVGPLLRELLDGHEARLHLVGHSYGAKVMLSALCAGDALPRKVQSVLLLQPAISHLCFADQVPGKNFPGGYRQALTRVEQPILSTFSSHDLALHKMFHLALRRDADLGEYRTANAGEPPSRYAALGGYGPYHAGEQRIPLRKAGIDYEFDPAVPVYGLDGAGQKIPGHGDISNDYTWWALYTLVSSPAVHSVRGGL